ncbi:MAG: phosphoglucomutase/phosphomannomutase PgmG [Alphaproteobacteria bacterium]
MNTAHQLPATILREYDIRGIVGETLTEDDAYLIGRAYGKIIDDSKGKTVAIGRDGRESSPVLEAALIKGITESGINVVQVGIGPSPMLYFAVYHLDLDGGIMITGSHNPANYNGFKMMNGKQSIYGPAIQVLGTYANQRLFIDAATKGTVSSEDISEAYVSRMLQDYQTGEDRPLKVAWDCGNGSAGAIIHSLTDQLPGEHILLYPEVDGTFPNHHPDPSVAENLQDLKAIVLAEKCDLGIAFDGDGDRIGVIDNEGEILWGDQLLAILSRPILAEHQGAAIIADVKASQIFFDDVIKRGGRAIMGKTGHSLIKAKMQEEKAKLAGEMSGHIFFNDIYYGYDDAPYAAIRLISQLAQTDTDETLAGWRKELPTTMSTPEMRFECPDERKFDVVKEVATRLNEAGQKFNDIDGVRYTDADGGWWLLRASNTQAALSARCESMTEKGLKSLKADLNAQLEKSGLTLPKV